MVANADTASGIAMSHGRLRKMSEALMTAELAVLRLLTLLLALVFVVNVPLNLLGRPIYWSGEVAINLMAIMAALGASVLVGRRTHPSVALLEDVLPWRFAVYLTLVSDLLVLLFTLVLLLLSLYLFDPLGVIEYIGNFSEYALDTGNFLYDQKLYTVGVKRFWFYLVWPVASLFMMVHAAKNIQADLVAIKRQGADS